MMMDRCSGEYAQDIAESLRFQEEIRSLMRLEPPGPESGSSFTALLGLPPNQAMELLHHEPPAPPEPAAGTATATATATGGNNDVPHAVIIPSSVATVNFPFGCSPTFPCNAALVERAARYSVFASPTEEGSPESSTVPSNSDGNNNNNNHSDSHKVKSEPADSDSNNAASSFATDKPPPPPTPAAAGQQRSGKRKELEKSKAKSGGGKKTKGGAGAGGEDGGAKGADGEKLPYVHVRARRGQATDSHSLAERARREKINARMKLLQELVPGCSKISGTALVLDEIINHVQSLQRQVEFLSMRLAAVNPRIDFSGLDSFLAAENARLTGGNGVGAAGLEAPLWGEVPIDGVRRHHHQQQIWQPDLVPPQQSSSLWERDDNHHSHPHQNYGFINPGPSLFGCDSANPVPLHANQLKTEL